MANPEWTDLEDWEDGADTEATLLARAAAKEVTGGNCLFVDEDIALLAALAQRAIDAGLTDGLAPSVLESLDCKFGRGKYAPTIPANTPA